MEITQNWRRVLQALFVGIFAAMVAVTAWASVEKNLWQGFALLWAERWGVATLADAYFGFVTFSVWMFYKERSLLSRLLWFGTILFFGNLAMSAYVLLAIYRLPRNAPIERLLLRGAPNA